MVGMMGAGKSSVGRRLAARLGAALRRCRHRDRAAANATIPEIFERHGEAYFRDGERRVIQRLLDGAPKVLATGGGAFIKPETRAAIQADGHLGLAEGRPRPPHGPRPAPLQPAAAQDRRSRGDDGRQLIDERYPIYAEATIHVQSRDVAHDVVIDDILAALDELPRRGREPKAARRCLTPRRRASLVRVELGERSYDILIGRGLIDKAGAEIARRLPGARARHRHRRDGRRPSPAPPGARASTPRASSTSPSPSRRARPRRASPRSRSVIDALLAARIERRDVVVALRRRRGRRSRRLRSPASCGAACASSRCRPRCSPRSIPRSAARPASTPATARTSSASSISRASSSPMPACSTRCRRAIFNAGYAEVAKYGLIGDARLLRLARGQLARRRRRLARARAGHRRRLPRQGRHRRRRRARERRPRPPQSRPHLRPCARGRHRLLRPAPPRRGASPIGMVLAFDFSRRARPLRRRTIVEPRRRPSRRGRPADPHRARSPAARLDADDPDAPHGPGQEGQARQAHLHPRPRHRPRLHRPRRLRPTGHRLPARRKHGPTNEPAGAPRRDDA